MLIGIKRVRVVMLFIKVESMLLMLFMIVIWVLRVWELFIRVWVIKNIVFDCIKFVEIISISVIIKVVGCLKFENVFFFGIMFKMMFVKSV